MGKLEDKFKKDHLVVVLGFFLASLGFLGYLFVTKPWHLFIVQAILGFGWAFGTPALDSVYSKNLAKTKMDSGWGTMESSVRIVEGISAFLGAIIASVFGFKILFIIMFLFSFIAFLITLRFLRKKRSLH